MRRLVAALRQALGVPSRAELARVRRELAEVHGLLTAYAAYHDARFTPGTTYDVQKWEAAAEHLDALCRAWLSAGHPLDPAAADEVLRRGRAGREALDEALRRLWRCS